MGISEKSLILFNLIPSVEKIAWFSLKSQCRSNDFLEALKQSTTRLHCYVNNKDHKIKFPLHFKQGSTLCIGDLDKLNLIWWFDYWLQPTFANVQAASKMQLTS